MQDGKYLVLAVDDDADITDSLKIVLEANGYAYVSAATAEEGLKVYKETNPDFVIVDLIMEEVDAGNVLVKELKLTENKAPIYMLSSVGDDLNKYVDYKELGLDGVLQKPINNDDLLNILKAKLS
jgi:DNA-binding response OmpR family regulator